MGDVCGAWLLVAGPLYQGAVELDEPDVDREAIEGIKASAIRTAPGRPSPWWWLVSPVMYVLRRRWTRLFRQATFAQLNQAQREQLTSFRNKATDVHRCCRCSLLLAAGETWQIVEHHHRWPVWLFWFLVAVMLAVAVLNTAVRMINDERTRRSTDAKPAHQRIATLGVANRAQ